MLRAGWPEYVTHWNREGIRWRDWNAVELLWIAHIQHFEYLCNHARPRVRRYLLDSGDLERLRAWDAGSFSEGEVSDG